MSIPEETRREAYYESREAAPTRRKEIYRRLLDGGPMMAETLMAVMGFMDPNNVRPRLTELRKAGLIRSIGKAHNRAGKKVTLWEAIPPEEIKRAAPGVTTSKDGSKEKNPTDNVPQGVDAVNGV